MINPWGIPKINIWNIYNAPPESDEAGNSLTTLLDFKNTPYFVGVGTPWWNEECKQASRAYHQLPVAFGSHLNRAQKDIQGQNAMNQALQEFIKCIWLCGDYKSRRHYTVDSSSDQAFTSIVVRTSPALVKPYQRNINIRGKMDRFTCNSSLKLKVSLVEPFYYGLLDKIKLYAKGDPKNALQECRKIFELQANSEINAARPDNVLELNQHTKVASLYQNCLAERNIGTAEACIRGIFKEVELPIELWDEVVSTNIYQRNRTSTGSIINGKFTNPEGVWT
ncbi:hypothetical protein EPUL_002105 [Erysiphe pulchra]|uniref:Uncharacterized protein n=1 Tax=Erysiphe pulchra TaxID=225359 RepID=A0A2S4PR52_9PEZI|nr:hypothetical protein EPUL_002105 [Erysiphe pulchra]